MGIKIHPSVTEKRIMEALQRQIITLDNPGFCLACGYEDDSCEPDAQAYYCEHCGEYQVYGAEELLLRFV
jgi:Zn finger protein HypA/HybF involved in hydrogenase expression